MAPAMKNPVHRYFNYDEETKYSTCLLCSKNLKGKHSTNLKSHLATKHAEEYKIVEAINIQLNNRRPPQTNSQSNVLENLKTECLKLVTVHGRPFALIHDDAFQTILKLAANREVSQINIKSMKDMVQEQAYKIREKISKEVRHRLVSLKLDSATCAERKFIGVNIQYVSNGCMVVRNLAVREITKSQTAAFLQECLDEILVDYKISIDNIYCICTDNGANMIKMVKLLGGKYVADEPLPTEEEEDDSDDDDYENYASFTAGLMNMDDILNDFLSTQNLNIRGMLCAAHTLQLAIKDAITSDPVAQSTIDTARKIVVTLRQPNNSHKMREAQLKKAIKDCATRWTSTFTMLERLHTFKGFCVEQLISIPENFWNNVDMLLACLKPANVATVKLQRKDITIGDFYIIWQSCKCEIENLQFGFANTLQQCMIARESKLLNNDVVLEALYIDRRINILLDSNQCAKAKNLLCETLSRLNKVTNAHDLEAENITSANNTNEPSVVASTSIRRSDFEERLLIAERARGFTRRTSSFECGLNDLINGERIPLHENILMHWNNFIPNRNISAVATTVLSAPATQVSVERLFSSLKFILNPLRSNLGPSLLRDIMTIRENKDLIE